MENQSSVDQRQRKVEQFLMQNREALARQGTIVTKQRRRGVRVFGPYYFLTCRVAGRQRSVYLGPAGELVMQVRKQLSTWQESRREQLQLNALARSLRRGLKAARGALAAELAPSGLFLKGAEIRGWRAVGGA